MRVYVKAFKGGNLTLPRQGRKDCFGCNGWEPKYKLGDLVIFLETKGGPFLGIVQIRNILGTIDRPTGTYDHGYSYEVIYKVGDDNKEIAKTFRQMAQLAGLHANIYFGRTEIPERLWKLFFDFIGFNQPIKTVKRKKRQPKKRTQKQERQVVFKQSLSLEV